MDPRIKAAKEAEEKKRKELLNKAFDRVIGSQLEKIAATTKKSDLHGACPMFESHSTWYLTNTM